MQSLRQALRSLGQAKGLTAVLLVSLALGTGANVAIIGILRALLLDPPAGVNASQRLVAIHTSQYSGASFGPTSFDDFESIRARATFLESVAAFDDGSVANAGVGQVQPAVRVAEVSDAFFTTIGMSPFRGRVHAGADDADPTPAAVISHSLWRSLGASDHLVGSTILVDAREHRLVGVTPPRFRGLIANRPTDVWIGLRPETIRGGRGDRRFSVIARLAGGATVETAGRELAQLGSELAAAHPATNKGTAASHEAERRLTPVAYAKLDRSARTNVALVGALVFAAAALLLASAGVNAGALLLSRTLARRRELAVKRALGASRGLLARQLLFEALLLAMAGAAGGLLVAGWTLDAVPALFSPEQADMLDTGLDRGLVLATVTLATLAGALFGIAPAVQGTRVSGAHALRSDSGGISEPSGGSTVRNVLVAAQVALSTVMVLSSGLLAGSLDQALTGDFGERGAHVFLVTIAPRAGAPNPAFNLDYQRRTLERLRDVPEVHGAGWVATPPLSRGATRRFRIGSGTSVTDVAELRVNIASRGYFPTLGLLLIEGRAFTLADDARSPAVVLVDETLARRYFGARAIGHRLLDEQGQPLEIVGVVRAPRYRTLQAVPEGMVYYPSSQEPLVRGTLAVYGDHDVQSLIPRVRDLLTAVDDRVPIARVRMLDEHLSDALAFDRLTITLVGICGLIAVLMASIGVYGVMGDAVRRRTREIGLRMALGATGARLAAVVLGSAVSLTVSGMGAGILLTVVARQVVASLVFGVPHVDAAALGFTSLALFLVVVVAAVDPLLRAFRISPTVALRSS